MTFKRRIPACTKKEQERQDRAREIGCICCIINGSEQGGATEIHHITRSGFTQSQDESVALCSWHHRSVCLPYMNSTQMHMKYGPSLAKGSKPFYLRYGNADALIHTQNLKIEDVYAV
jgi:hypothetical protein